MELHLNRVNNVNDCIVRTDNSGEDEHSDQIAHYREQVPVNVTKTNLRFTRIVHTIMSQLWRAL